MALLLDTNYYFLNNRNYYPQVPVSPEILFEANNLPIVGYRYL